MFLPEGLRPSGSFTLSSLRDAMSSGAVLEAPVQRCGADRTLYIPLGPVAGQMAREEVLSPWISGSERDISVLSRVGKVTCFTVKSITADGKGAPVALLSRREVQERALDFFLETLLPGTVLTCRVTHLASFGAFLDIGCGVVAMLPIERISISRIRHPGDRFQPSQKILAAVLSVDRERRRFTMTHRELLGTWMQNASRFQVGETTTGIVRSIENYGVFVELTPNLAGLAELRDGIHAGNQVSVYIKNILPRRMKMKLIIIEEFGPAPISRPVPVYMENHMDSFLYSPPECEKKVETVFSCALTE